MIFCERTHTSLVLFLKPLDCSINDSVLNFIKGFLGFFPHSFSFPFISGLCNLKTLAIHVDKSACLETQVRQLVQMANQQQNKFDLRPLLESIDNIKQKVAFLESFDQRLGTSGILFLLQFSDVIGLISNFQCKVMGKLAINHLLSWVIKRIKKLSIWKEWAAHSSPLVANSLDHSWQGACYGWGNPDALAICAGGSGGLMAVHLSCHHNWSHGKIHCCQPRIRLGHNELICVHSITQTWQLQDIPPSLLLT